ncbi:ZPR1 zinc finger domain-containing protein [Candidatus Woesearchaeota archaeon]|nr:ZPR1 zinc finger domain-containing protein [Candidatus Woesearchaeota archaeon]
MAKETENVLKGQPCPVCKNKTLILSETESDVPFFGKMFLFSMSCESCKYRKADIEAAEQKEPCRFTFEVANKDDLAVRVVKSADAVVKIPHVGSIEPGPGSEGYITNIEGVLTKIKEQVEMIRDTEEDEDTKKKAKNLLKKIQNILWGEEKIKIIIEDPTGNSAIISEKAVKERLKK